jgi:hypothetical protein
MQPHGHWGNAHDLQVGKLVSRSNLSLHVQGISIRNEITTVYNLTVADYHTYAVGIYEALVHNKAMKNKLAADDFGFQPKRQTQNNNMKPGHVFDKKTMDALENKYNWSKQKRQEFHLYIRKLKARGEVLTWDVLDELARDF